jgi:hypothetical protein
VRLMEPDALDRSPVLGLECRWPREDPGRRYRLAGHGPSTTTLERSVLCVPLPNRRGRVLAVRREDTEHACVDREGSEHCRLGEGALGAAGKLRGRNGGK